ncbi:hypothetical protein E0494_05165 [Marinilabiliaceae bacterium JC040]|nr:hypothetical protein [Marinilabiliaceae bacterium JC040]
MWYIVIGLLGLAALVILFTLIHSKIQTKNAKEGEEIVEDYKDVSSDCCGAHQICELDMRKLKKTIVYFDDEELDAYKNKRENEYSEKEVDEFRDVLYTLQPQEVREWVNSLEIREINIPEVLKQETISMMTL